MLTITKPKKFKTEYTNIKFKKRYQSIIDALIYTILETQPNLIYTILIISHYKTNLLTTH